MNEFKNKVANAEKEAIRFLQKVKAYKQRIKDDSYMAMHITGCKESGAVKRAKRYMLN